MAAITGTAIAAGTAAYTIAQAEKRKKEARRELNNYEREVIDNAYEEMPISLEGLDYIRDENAGMNANAVESARNAGARGVIGAVPKIVAAGNDVNAGIAENLDNQFNRRNYAIAGDNSRIEGIRENRDMQNINALSSQINAANQDFYNGVLGLGSALSSGIRNYSPAPNPQVTAASLSSAGPVAIQTPLPSATPYGFSTPYSSVSGMPFNPNNLYGDAFSYDDMINKY